MKRIYVLFLFAVIATLSNVCDAKTGVLANSAFSAPATNSALSAPAMNFVDGGTYHTEEPLVITNREEGAEIIYYIDYDYTREYRETAPSVEVYFSETGIHVVEAYIVKPGYAQSETKTAIFMIKEKLGGVPTFSLSEGTYGTGQTLTVTSSKKSAKVCYMLNDDYIIETGESTATIELPAVVGEVKTYTVTAYEETENGVSDKVTKVYVIDEKTLDPPMFSLAPGLYGTTQSVTITAREGSTIMYMLNEDIEEAPSPVVIELPAVDGQQTDYTLTALASLDGYKDSDEAKAVYSIYPGYEAKTATLDIPKYALENKWIDNYEYYTVQVDDVTFALDEDIILCGTYYVDVDAWTPGLDGKITISVPDKHVLNSIVFTLAEVNSSYIESADKGELDLNEWKATDKETSEVTFDTYDTIYIQKVQVNYSYFPTSSVSSISTSADIRVVEADGGIVIEADKTADVTVYNISGQVVSACRVAEGTTHIDLPTGFYIVRAAGTAAKVAVK